MLNLILCMHLLKDKSLNNYHTRYLYLQSIERILNILKNHSIYLKNISVLYSAFIKSYRPFSKFSQFFSSSFFSQILTSPLTFLEIALTISANDHYIPTLWNHSLHLELFTHLSSMTLITLSFLCLPQFSPSTVTF